MLNNHTVIKHSIKLGIARYGVAHEKNFLLTAGHTDNGLRHVFRNGGKDAVAKYFGYDSITQPTPPPLTLEQRVESLEKQVDELQERVKLLEDTQY